MTTLEDLYYGNISPHERYIKRGARVDKLVKLICKNEEELTSGLTEKQKETFEKFKDYTLAELQELDFGYKCAEEFKGLKITAFEEILKKFTCHCVMNIHLKTAGEKQEYLDRVVRLIKKYDCEKYVYFMSGNDKLLARLQKEYPEITRCCGGGAGMWEIVDRAIKYGCKKLQFVKGYFNQEMVDKAKANNIITNVFWSDDPEETEKFLDMGIDTVLTNDYHRIAQTVEKYR